MSAASSQRVAFGTSQDRKLFPLHFAPDRLGNEMSRQGAPDLGPGSYDNHKVGVLRSSCQSGNQCLVHPLQQTRPPLLLQLGTMLYDLHKTPRSKRGYFATTAARFPACSKVRREIRPVVSVNSGEARFIQTTHNIRWLWHMHVKVCAPGVTPHSSSFFIVTMQHAEVPNLNS